MRNKQNVLVFLLGAFCSALLLLGCYSYFRYYDNISSMKPISLSYNGKQTFCSLSSDYCERLTTPKRTLYFGKLPDDSETIELIVPRKVTITVYPCDEDSVVIKYDPHKIGITRNYKLSEYGDFNKHLEILNEMMSDET